MSEIFLIYNQFLSYFPDQWHWAVSLALAIILVIAIFKVVKRNFIFLIVLIVLLPASVPILKEVWEGIVFLVKFLLTRR